MNIEPRKVSDAPQGSATGGEPPTPLSPTAPVRTGPLSGPERDELATAEETIGTGLKIFFEVGEALKRVRDRRLYRDRFATFEEYLKRRWDLSRGAGYHLIDTATLKENLSSIDDIL